MERHKALDKHPRAEVVAMPRACDGVGNALRQTFAPIKDDVFSGLLDKLDQRTLNRARGG